MTDFYDRASDREQELRDDAIAAQRRRTAADQGTPSAEFCRICEGPIPEARREHVPGVQTCVDCQNDLEIALNRNGGRR